MRNLVILLCVLLVPNSSIAISEKPLIEKVADVAIIKPVLIKTKKLPKPVPPMTPKTKQQIECLAQNIYYEAGSEPKKGQIAVAMVTLKRVNHHAYPNTVCGVVRQKYKETCQFSWWCEEEKRQKVVSNGFDPKEKVMLNRIRRVAEYAYLNYKDIHDETYGALFYHNTSVNPNWKYKKTTQIGNHIFYKRG